MRVVSPPPIEMKIAFFLHEVVLRAPGFFFFSEENRTLFPSFPSPAASASPFRAVSVLFFLPHGGHGLAVVFFFPFFSVGMRFVSWAALLFFCWTKRRILSRSSQKVAAVPSPPPPFSFFPFVGPIPHAQRSECSPFPPPSKNGGKKNGSFFLSRSLQIRQGVPPFPPSNGDSSNFRFPPPLFLRGFWYPLVRWTQFPFSRRWEATLPAPRGLSFFTGGIAKPFLFSPSPP